MESNRMSADRASVISLDLTDDDRKHAARQNAIYLLSILYTILFVLMGFVLSVSSVVYEYGGESEQAFVSVFYLIGIISLIYLLLYIYIQERQIRKKEAEIKNGHNLPLQEKESQVDRQPYHPDSPEVGVKLRNKRRQYSLDDIDFDEIKRKRGRTSWQNSIKSIFSGSEINLLKPYSGNVPAITYLSSAEASLPSFYLRLGMVCFGLGTVIFYSLRICSAVYIGIHCDDGVWKWNLIHSCIYVFFGFLQMFFLFKYGKISINKHTGMARFALCHIFATNLVEWIQACFRMIESLCKESGLCMLQTSSNSSTKGQVADNTSCYEKYSVSTFDVTLHNGLAYLYPLIIQYCLISLVCLHRVIANIGSAKRIHKKTNITRPISGKTIRANRFSVDCTKSDVGLFLGILTLVYTLISCVLFNTLVHKKEYELEANLTYTTCQGALLITGLIGTIVGLVRMQKLRYTRINNGAHTCTDVYIMIFSVAGVYGHRLASFYTSTQVPGPLTFFYFIDLAMPLITIAQATLQICYCTDALHRRCNSKELLKTKPGRNSVFFMLMVNLSLWLMSMVMGDDGVLTYGQLHSKLSHNHVQMNDPVWPLINYVTIPFLILFRFQATVCLAEIWKIVYSKKQMIVDSMY